MSSIANFKLSNVLGSMYQRGNLVFSRDGETLFSPVANKIALFSLKGQKSTCLSHDSDSNYSVIALSPDGGLLLVLNERGLGLFINVLTGALATTFRFGKIACIKFSPNGKWIAVGDDKTIKVYRVPISIEKLELVRVFKDIGGQVSTINWSYDSKLIAAGSKDSPMVSLFSMYKFKNFKSSCFTGHTEGLLGVYFEDFDYNIYSICR